YYLERQVRALSMLPVTFGLIGPLALAGLVLAARRWRTVWPLYLLAAAVLAPMLAFYVLARFRLAFAAAMLPFAAYAILECVRWVEARRLTRAAALALSVALVSTWTGRPLEPDQHLIRMAD